MKKLIVIAVACTLVGCAQENKYSAFFNGERSIDEQMKITKTLEENGWTKVGVYQTHNGLQVIAEKPCKCSCHGKCR